MTQNSNHENSKGAEYYTILESAKKLAPLYQQMVPIDCSIAVTDREKFLVDLAGSDDELTSNEGKRIPEGSGLYKALNSGVKQDYYLSKEIYGNAFKASAVPLVDNNGKVVGAMAMRLSMKNQEMLNETSNAFASAYEEVVATTESMASSTQELSGMMETLSQKQEEMSEKIAAMEKMLRFVKDVAANSNLLGINASIEAARVGENGRGFEVVANEIRKMADNSTKSVEEIQENIQMVKQQASLLSEEITKIADISHNQAASAQEITASMQGLLDYVENIEKVAQII